MKTVSDSTLEEIGGLEKKTIFGRVCRELLWRRKNSVVSITTELPEKPARAVYQWGKAIYRDCGYCGNYVPTVFDSDDTPICADCAAVGFEDQMETYADKLKQILLNAKAEAENMPGEQG